MSAQLVPNEEAHEGRRLYSWVKDGAPGWFHETGNSSSPLGV
jgi:hypothetical protein